MGGGGEWEGEAGLLVPYAGGEATYYDSLLLLAAIRVRLKNKHFYLCVFLNAIIQIFIFSLP